MVRTYVRKTKIASYSEQSLQNAVNDVQNKKLSLRKAAATYGISKSTIERHLKSKVLKPCQKKVGRFEPALDIAFELELVDHIKKMQVLLFGLSEDAVCKLAYELAKANNINVPFNHLKKKAGKDWLCNFLKRHPSISLRQPEATSISRATGFNKVQVSTFFKKLKEVIEQNQITGNKIYNIDETGVSSVQRTSKILAKKGSKVGQLTSAERGKNVTLVACMSALGHYIPPAFIFKRKRMINVLLKGAPQGSIGFPSDSGWIDTKIFLAWMEHFQAHTNASVEHKVLLILDNHSSHISLAAINFARKHGIIMLSLPPKCSHKMQPLDKTFFFPLKTYYSQEVNKWLVNNPGKRVTDFDIAGLIGKAYERTATLQKAVNGFKSTGIWPYNPDIFDDSDYAAASVTEIAESSTTCAENSASSLQVEEQFLHPASLDISPPAIPQADEGYTSTALENAPSGLTQVDLQPASLNVVDVLAANSAVRPMENEPSCSDENARVFIADISPLPQAQLSSRKRKAMRSEVLTSSPYKKALISKKNRHSATKPKKRVKKKRLQFDAKADYACIFCLEAYQHPPTEDWIECRKCKKWCHDKCSSYSGKGDYVCDFCNV